ncbi:MAG: hypothetical protein U0903_16715 [Planctomycetales bacterium]
MSEQNKRVVLQYVEAFNQGDLDALCSTFGPEGQIYAASWAGGTSPRLGRDLERTHPLLSDEVAGGVNHRERGIVAVRYTERGISTEFIPGRAGHF